MKFGSGIYYSPEEPATIFLVVSVELELSIVYELHDVVTFNDNRSHFRIFQDFSCERELETGDNQSMYEESEL